MRNESSEVVNVNGKKNWSSQLLTLTCSTKQRSASLENKQSDFSDTMISKFSQSTKDQQVKEEQQNSTINPPV